MMPDQSIGLSATSAGARGDDHPSASFLPIVIIRLTR
jgi:hypothetical protein